MIEYLEHNGWTHEGREIAGRKYGDYFKKGNFYMMITSWGTLDVYLSRAKFIRNMWGDNRKVHLVELKHVNMKTVSKVSQLLDEYGKLISVQSGQDRQSVEVREANFDGTTSRQVD